MQDLTFISEMEYKRKISVIIISDDDDEEMHIPKRLNIDVAEGSSYDNVICTDNSERSNDIKIVQEENVVTIDLTGEEEDEEIFEDELVEIIEDELDEIIEDELVEIIEDELDEIIENELDEIIEDIVEEDVEEVEVGGYSENVLAWNCDPTRPISYSWSNERNDVPEEDENIHDDIITIKMKFFNVNDTESDDFKKLISSFKEIH
ncbi:hypothetical protein AGLY_017650 [Aphis glycines]|uniref:Uncharacterized protein n=1 Tax=Aphis glycines TaxID=307491 RepID=A0A6G0SUY0_APHGL|nr:hypothetical protein AGLY_017650 [Aphis glycines]